MTVTETLMALGSWSVALSEETPDYVLSQLGYFGHIAVIDGGVDPERIGDGLLAGAKYVGVLREKDNRTGRVLSGEGMAYWLGDEDGKGHLIESKLDLTGKTFVQAVTAVLALDPSVSLGLVETRPGTYTGSHQYVTPREVLTLVCQAFGAEYRVNGNGSVDCGTPGFLYNTTAPDTIIVRKGAGSDLNMVALGSNPEVQESARDWSSRVVLIGQTTPTDSTDPAPFVTATADAPSVPYLDLFGHPVASVRAISESGTTEGAAAARAQLQINRFARLTRSLRLNAEEFDTEGNFVVGDAVWVYDPDTGIVNAANEVLFQGQVWHPESIRSISVTWPVVEGYTVAFRTQAGVWVDLTRWVLWENSGTDITVGDLPQSLTSAGDSTISLRVDAASANGSDTTIPNAPTGLGLVAFSGLNTLGRTVSILSASWTAPGLNTDGSTLTDLSYYLVEYRWTARSVWQQALVIGTSVEVEVAASLPYEVRVAAVDLSGHQSAWSATVAINSAKDSVAPPAPADPVVTSYLGQLRIEYLGTDAAGQPMPTDTNRVDVHVGTTSSFVFDVSTRVASLAPFGKGVAYATAPYSATNNRWVRLVAYDHDGNVSASSAAVGGRTVQVGDGDIASLSVGKLTTGTITTDIIVAGNLVTALTGQRSGMTALGFQAWDAANNQTILLNGVANLLTGTLQTALSGQRRIVIGASGNRGTIDFIAPDGTLGRIQGFTTAVGTVGEECIQIGMPITGVHPAWNSMQIQADQQIWTGTENLTFVIGDGGVGGTFFVAHALSKGTATTPPTTRGRMKITPSMEAHYRPDGTIFSYATATDVLHYWPNGEVAYWLGATQGNHRWYNPAGASTDARRVEIGIPLFEGPTILQSPSLTLISQVHTNGSQYGQVLKYVTHTTLTDGRVQVTSIDESTYAPLWASAFVVSSSGTVKESVKALEPGALNKIRGLGVKKYRRKRDDDVIGPEEIGVIAEEVAALVPEVTKDDGKMIDLYGLVALLLAAVQELDKKGKP